MIKINHVEKDSVRCCTSCHRDNLEVDNYEMLIGKSERNTMTIRLCADCLKEFIEKGQEYIRASGN